MHTKRAFRRIVQTIYPLAKKEPAYPKQRSKGIIKTNIGTALGGSLSLVRAGYSITAKEF
jgi:hypothetical protein